MSDPADGGRAGPPEGNARFSKAQDAELISDPKERAEAEARNGLRQFDLAIDLIETWLARRKSGGLFRLRPSMILDLHRVALEGINAYAGNWRPAGVEIEGSDHAPPASALAPSFVEDMCDYVNENFETSTPLHLAAFVMWRVNWIHPFADGNGRTARILSYVLLCVKLGYVLPGTNTIPDQIVRNRQPYFDALEAADEAAQDDKIDVTRMEGLLGDMLSQQLVSIADDAGII